MANPLARFDRRQRAKAPATQQSVTRYTDPQSGKSLVFNPSNLALPSAITRNALVVREPGAEQLFWEQLRRNGERVNEFNPEHVTFTTVDVRDEIREDVLRPTATHYTTIHKAPTDWRGIANALKAAPFLLCTMCVLGLLGTGIYQAVQAAPHGFGGGGSGMGPPPINSYSSATGSICYRNTAHHPVSAAQYTPVNGVATAEKGKGGHYYIDGIINGGLVHFMIDTGADHTVLPQDVAEELGLHGEYSDTAQTANGTTHMARVRVGNVHIGGIVAHDIVIGVVPRVDQPLLGMDVINQLGSWGVENGRFVLRANGRES